MRRTSVLVSVNDCPLSLVEITVGIESDDFMRRQALTCYRLDVLPLLGQTVICVQPVNGRYVTIQERSYTSTACMSLCDITIYVGMYTVLQFAIREIQGLIWPDLSSTLLPY